MTASWDGTRAVSPPSSPTSPSSVRRCGCSTSAADPARSWASWSLGSGSDRVAAVDPSGALRRHSPSALPGVDVRVAAAERLPFADDEFDAALAQLVVHFMSDPVAGLSEMARVTRTGGVVAACVWDHASDHGPLGVFWAAARDLDPASTTSRGSRACARGTCAELLEDTGRAGASIEEATLIVRVEQPTFHEWWEPFTRGVGPAGAYVASLDERDRRGPPRAVPDRAAERAIHDHGACVGGSTCTVRGAIAVLRFRITWVPTGGPAWPSCADGAERTGSGGSPPRRSRRGPWDDVVDVGRRAPARSGIRCPPPLARRMTQ